MPSIQRLAFCRRYLNFTRVECSSSAGDDPTKTDIILTLAVVNPARQELIGIGGFLYELMELGTTIPESELQLLATSLNQAFV